MKKGPGQREESNWDVKFSNKGNVELLPLKKTGRKERLRECPRRKDICGRSVCNGNFHNKNSFCG